MRTIRTKVFKFEELSDEAKEQAIEEYAHVNVEPVLGWWESTYEDAANIGIKITGFDLDRANYCKGEFNLMPALVASNIIREHGESTATYRTAQYYIADYNLLVEKHSDGINTATVCIDKESDFAAANTDLEGDFLNSLLEDYKKLLKEDFEYLTGNDAIRDTIIANGYEFTKDGEKFNH